MVLGGGALSYELGTPVQPEPAATEWGGERLQILSPETWLKPFLDSGHDCRIVFHILIVFKITLRIFSPEWIGVRLG